MPSHGVMRWFSSLAGAAPVTLIHLLSDLPSFSFWILHLSAFQYSYAVEHAGTCFFFFWKKLHRVQVTSPGSWLLQGPRAAVSRCTSWEIALSNLPGLYWLLFPSFGFWLFLRAQTLTLSVSTPLGDVFLVMLSSLPPLTVSKTTLSSFLWVQFLVISCLLTSLVQSS